MVDLRQPAAQLGTAVATAVICLALAVVAGRAWRADAAVVDVPPTSRVVVLGSSIAMADVAVAPFAAGLGRTEAEVLHLGERASQPAHWLALLRHQVGPSGAGPTDVVLVTPLEALLRERLRSDVDTERLLVLLRAPDAELWSAAVGADGRARFWGRQRAAARRWLRGGLGDWLPRALGLSAALATARAEASAVPRSEPDKPQWLVDPAAPRPGRAADAPRDREPERSTPTSWRLVPALADEARSLRARLWVVAPPVRPADRGPPCARSREFVAIGAALAALDVEVVDASDADLDAGWFRTRYHLEGEGAAQFSRALGQVLAGGTPPWRGCGPTRGRGAG